MHSALEPTLAIIVLCKNTILCSIYKSVTQMLKEAQNYRYCRNVEFVMIFGDTPAIKQNIITTVG